jgi:hypothetical protein
MKRGKRKNLFIKNNVLGCVNSPSGEI